MEKIIFLDIDGPMIPTPVFFLDMQASLQRTVMSNIAVALVNSICRKAGAKIVTNTQHNYHLVDGGVAGDGSGFSAQENLKDSLIRHGVKEEYFHKNWRTIYPEDPNTGAKIDRWQGVSLWQHDNGEADWIGFDDMQYTVDPRLIVIDMDYGITYFEYQMALDHFEVAGGDLIW